MFDGTILQYNESRETKNTCEEIAVLLNCTQNSNELESDHIFSKQGREAFGMDKNKAVCLLRDRGLHRHKTKYSVDLYCIANGFVLRGKVYNNYMMRDRERSENFIDKQVQLPPGDTKWDPKWQVLNRESQMECIEQGWHKCKVAVSEDLELLWKQTPYKSVLYWGRVYQQSIKNRETFRNKYALNAINRGEVERRFTLLQKDIAAVCTIAKGTS